MRDEHVGADAPLMIPRVDKPNDRAAVTLESITWSRRHPPADGPSQNVDIRSWLEDPPAPLGQDPLTDVIWIGPIEAHGSHAELVKDAAPNGRGFGLVHSRRLLYAPIMLAKRGTALAAVSLLAR
jgi:hypothetical protein